MHTKCYHQKGVLELDSDDTFVKPFHWSSISQAYTAFYMLKTSQGQWLWICIVWFIRILKALNTYTHNKPYSRLRLLISRLLTPIVDLPHTIVDLVLPKMHTNFLYLICMHISRLICSYSRLIYVIVDLYFLLVD